MSLRNRAVPAQVRPVGAVTQRIRAQQGAAMEWPRERLAAAIAGQLTHFDELPSKAAPRRSSREYLQLRAEALQCALTQPCVARHEEPGELVSLANRRGISVQAMHAKKRSLKAQRAMGERIAREFRACVAVLASLGCLASDAAFAVVVITRISPRLLDSDNAEAAAKGVRDGIAAGLGVDDRSPLVRYCVSQEQGAPRECRVRAELHIQPKEQTK